MSKVGIGKNGCDNVRFYVSSEAYEKLVRHAGDVTPDEFAEALLEDGSRWPLLAAQIRANRAVAPAEGFVRDAAQRVAEEMPNCPSVLCRCCPGGCRHAFPWRQRYRCGCSPERLALGVASGKA
jgi:hypothetical protein